MSSNLTPFQVCEALIGKPEQIAAVCCTADKSPFAWRHPSKGRDAGDIPSAAHMRRLLDHSDAQGLGLTAEHLIRGAAEDEIEAILIARGAPAPVFTPRRARPGPAMEAAE